MKNWTISVVPHTHWDKEWYFTKQDSDVILCENINKYLKMYSQNKECFNFTYDGQSSIIDDYLVYHSNANNELLWESLEKKKLIIGPWYTQPDFFNLTSESIIRNLLIGIETALGYNAKYLKTAYVPDSFGHNWQMPQIYQQFGLSNFVYWRGTNEKDLDSSTIHWWEGIDGTKILAYNFYFGYWTMGTYFPYLSLKPTNLKEKAQIFLEEYRDILKILKDKVKNVTKNLLLPLGGDQAPVTELLAEFIAKVDELDEEHHWVVSDYDTYFKIAQFNNLKDVSGELKTPFRARIHKTIGSQRIDLKIKIKKIEYLLFNGLEPLATYYFLNGGTYPKEIITKILKLLLTCQAHDSLGGCNSDETNKDINNRLSQARDLILTLVTKLIKTLINDIADNEFVIFNPAILEQQNKSQYEVTLFTKNKLFSILNENNKFMEFIIKDQQYCGGGYDVIPDANGENSVLREGFFMTKILLLNLPLNLFSLTKFKIVAEKNINKYHLELCQTLLTNKWKISINKDGTFDLFDKINNIFYKNQFKLIADHDLGDSYDYSPSRKNIEPLNKLLQSKIVSIKSNSKNYGQITVKNIYSIPSAEGKKLINQEFIFKLTISNDEIINIAIDGENKATEIRWRISYINDSIVKSSFANQAYCTLSRPIILIDDLAIWEKNNWKEKPVAIETNESFVYIKNNNYKIGFVTCGNNEYEVINNSTNSILLLTLFRSVPFLGRDNLLYRPGRASGVNELTINTNDAKLQTRLKFRFAWFATAKENIWHLAEKWNTQTVFYQKQKYNPVFQHGDRFLIPQTDVFVNKNKNLTIKVPDSFVVKSVKKAENNNSLIIRGFNNDSNDISINFTFLNKQFKCVNELNLLEKIVKTNIKNDIVSKYQIKTYEFVLQEGEK